MRVFNSLLERQEDSDIEFVRAHRALRARGPDTAPPRDIICRLQNYPLKEDIMRKARRNEHNVFNGANIMFYQDLSQITLKNRWALRPLLDKLRKRPLRYTWRFPFALVVTNAGKQYILRLPTDLPDFCEALVLELSFSLLSSPFPFLTLLYLFITMKSKLVVPTDTTNQV